jgi:hypothetical protein
LKIRALIILWLVALCALAMCGAGTPDIGLSGANRMAMGLKSGLGQGSSSAGWDTISVLWTMDPSIDHILPRYDRWHVVCDSMAALGKGGVYQWGFDDTSFAYMAPDSLASTTWFAGGDSAQMWFREANNDKYIVAHSTNGNDGNTFFKWDSARDTQTRVLMVHLGDTNVPPGSSVVSATLHFRAVSYVSATTDTISATLMTNPTDNVWYKYKKIYEGTTFDQVATDKAAYMAKGSYTYQKHSLGAAQKHGYNGGTSLGRWNPGLSTRNYYWQWGSVYDLTGQAANAAATIDLAIDVTDCVQGIADGLTNNGIALVWNRTSQWDHGFFLNGFDPRAAGAEMNYRPWLEIKYTTKNHAANFPGGKDWAFLFSVDDGLYKVNNTYIPIFKAHGGKYTIGAVGIYSPGNAIFANVDTILSWHDRGMEIATHGQAHRALTTWTNLNAYKHGAGADGWAASDTTTYATAWDSMKVEYTATWLNDAATAKGRDMSSSRRWGKSLIMPYFDFSSWSQMLTQRLGYSTVRVGAMTSNTVGSLAAVGMGRAVADTAKTGAASIYERRPRNAMLLPIRFAETNIVGGKAVNISEANLKLNMRRLVGQVKGTNSGVLTIMTHDLKNGFDVDYGDNGIDADELGWMLDVVDEMGGAYMTHTEFGDWIRGNSTMQASKPDSASAVFKFTAGQSVWARPKGIDTRWIRGVR